MMELVKVVLVLISALNVLGAELESMENTFNCYSDYLKRHGVLEPHFQNEPFNGESQLCEAVLSTTVAEVYRNLLKEFKRNDQLHDSAECIVEELRKAKWSDLDIKEQVIVFTESLTEPEKELKMKEIKQFQNEISSSSILTCEAGKEFGGLFEQIFNKDDSSEDKILEFCARSYAVDNKLIDTNIYKVVTNPEGLDPMKVDCQLIMQKNFREAEMELRLHLLKDIGENTHQADCLIKKYHDNHYFNKTLAVELLGELNISKDQKEFEKKKFIENMIKITKSLTECQ